MSSVPAVKPKKADSGQNGSNERPTFRGPMWINYKVTWDFTTGLFSSTPADKDLIQTWVESRMPAVMPPAARTVQEIVDEVYASTLAEGLKTDEEKLLAEEAARSKSLLVFQRHKGNLVFRASTTRSHIKDCATILSSRVVGKLKGFPSFASLVKNCVYHDEKQYYIPILHQEDDTPFTEPTGTFAKAVHATVWMGGQPRQINALKEIQYVNNARMRFRLKVLADNVVQEDLERIFGYGGVHGYAGERGDGEGRYTFTVERE